MSLAWVLCLFSCLFSAAYGAEVCFDGLGCFHDQAPWGGTADRPISCLPWGPEAIGTRFLLFTQTNRYYQEIKADDAIISASNFRGYRKTRVVIPGYLEAGDEDWAQALCKAIVKAENVNCIAVEWKKGVQTEFAQAANNARVVAAQTIQMMRFLMDFSGAKAEKFHLIGHSMGAHAAGYVGQNITGIPRITGLDPVEPYFGGKDATVHLDKTDAGFVDVIHTDSLPFHPNLGLGVSESIGHVDFYPNGGERMPGCRKNSGNPDHLDAIWQGTGKFTGCNHVRSYQYYTESVSKRDGFQAYACADVVSFDKKNCFPCAAGSCRLMGHFTDESAGASDMKFFLSTGESEPYGRYGFRMRVTLSGPSWPNPGYMYVALQGAKLVTQEFTLHRGMLSPGAVYEVFIDAEIDVGEVTDVKFRWNNHVINPMKPKYGASHVELLRGSDAKITTYCSTENVRENDIQCVLPCKAKLDAI